ncbi:hypothetical protein QN395_21465 [Undibacterium sp. RTI2.2]|nr:hypothetical protein [Undibacterium sp. RTI2.2]MEB0119044.1 hypothetical protein [Undibacterium sp. RTI2.2]
MFRFARTSALIQLTLDGSLVQDGHQVSLRVLSRALLSIQAATDRAFLDIRYGGVSKHQRLHYSQYSEADFIVGDPKEGSYVIEFLSTRGQDIIRRLREAIKDPYIQAAAGGDQQIYTISHQIAANKGALKNKILHPQSFDDFLKAPSALLT